MYECAKMTSSLKEVFQDVLYVSDVIGGAGRVISDSYDGYIHVSFATGVGTVYILPIGKNYKISMKSIFEGYISIEDAVDMLRFLIVKYLVILELTEIYSPGDSTFFEIMILGSLCQSFGDPIRNVEIQIENKHA